MVAAIEEMEDLDASEVRDSEDQLEVAQDRNKGSMQKKC